MISGLYVDVLRIKWLTMLGDILKLLSTAVPEGSMFAKFVNLSFEYQ